MSDIANTEIDEDYQEQLEDQPASMTGNPPTPDIVEQPPSANEPEPGVDDPEDDPNAVDWESFTVEELKADADKYDLTVQGTGANGEPVRADYVSALEAWEAEQE